MTVASAVVAGDRIRDSDIDGIPVLFVFSRTAAARLAASGRAVCLASPQAVPVRTASLSEIRLDRSVTSVDLRAALREAARAVHAEGTVVLSAALSTGHGGFWRRVASAILPLPHPHRPEDIPREMVLAGFDRVEQEIRGSIGLYRARRPPGLARNSPMGGI